MFPIWDRPIREMEPEKPEHNDSTGPERCKGAQPCYATPEVSRTTTKDVRLNEVTYISLKSKNLEVAESAIGEGRYTIIEKV